MVCSQQKVDVEEGEEEVVLRCDERWQPHFELIVIESCARASCHLREGAAQHGTLPLSGKDGFHGRHLHVSVVATKLHSDEEVVLLGQGYGLGVHEEAVEEAGEGLRTRESAEVQGFKLYMGGKIGGVSGSLSPHS